MNLVMLVFAYLCCRSMARATVPLNFNAFLKKAKLKAYGFIQTFGEACIYKKVSGSSVAFLILYVDDILLIGNDIEFLDSIKGYLNKSFSVKDLGEAAYILGIKIYRDR